MDRAARKREGELRRVYNYFPRGKRRLAFSKKREGGVAADLGRSEERLKTDLLRVLGGIEE